MVVQRNTKLPPTDKNDFWCLSFRLTVLDLDLVTVIFCVKTSQICEVVVTSLGHRIIDNAVIPHGEE